ncbi:hypothetical protein BHM03_00024976 [Ensete ventricosum]|nr:hypothetical protein BHM03_00024976 [Ensete ventricosum]
MVNGFRIFAKCSRFFGCFFIVKNFRYGKIYLKAAKSFVEKGADYAKKEIDWLQLMLEKVIKSISPSNADEFIIKKNILSTFAA